MFSVPALLFCSGLTECFVSEPGAPFLPLDALRMPTFPCIAYPLLKAVFLLSAVSYELRAYVFLFPARRVRYSTLV